MKVFKDIFSDDEMFTEAYQVEVVDDLLYLVRGNLRTEKFTLDESAIGGNKSAEGEVDDDVEEAAKTDLDIVLNNRLQELKMDMGKKEYKADLQKYIKEVKKWLQEHKPERVEFFEKNAITAFNYLAKRFKHFGTFYKGETMAPNGMLVPLDWGEDENTPTFIFFKDGLKEEKY